MNAALNVQIPIGVRFRPSVILSSGAKSRACRRPQRRCDDGAGLSSTADGVCLA